MLFRGEGFISDSCTKDRYPDKVHSAIDIQPSRCGETSHGEYSIDCIQVHGLNGSICSITLRQSFYPGGHRNVYYSFRSWILRSTTSRLAVGRSCPWLASFIVVLFQSPRVKSGFIGTVPERIVYIDAVTR